MKNHISNLYHSLPPVLRAVQVLIILVFVVTALYSWSWIGSFQRISSEQATLIDITGRQRMLSQRLLIAFEKFGVESEEFVGTKRELEERQGFLGEKLAKEGYDQMQRDQFAVADKLLDNYLFAFEDSAFKVSHWQRSTEYVLAMDQLNLYHRDFIDEQLRRLFILIIIVLTINALSIISEFTLIILPILYKLIGAREAEEEKSENLKKTVNKMGKVHLQVAHDLKSPIQAAILKAELIEATIATKPELAPAMLDQLKNQIMHIDGTVSQIDKLIKGRALKKSEVPLKLLFEKTLLNLEQVINESKAIVNLKLDCSIYVDVVEFTIALQNLISNSIKYSQPGLRAVIEVDCRRDDEFDTLTISDNGIGIAQENIDKVFKFSFREKAIEDKVEGKGIGLYTVKEIVEKHGGSVSLTSQLNKGTTVSIRVPKRGQALL